MVTIRQQWPTLDFRFEHVFEEFNVGPTIPLSELDDAKKPIASLGFKKMCSFKSKRMYELPALHPYQYIFKVDDDTCIADHVISYDIFAAMKRENKTIAYHSIFNDAPKTTFKFVEYVQRYMKNHSISTTNTPVNTYVMDRFLSNDQSRVLTFAGNFEVVDRIRYTQPDIIAFLQTVVESNNIFHYRWGDHILLMQIVIHFIPVNQVGVLCDVSYRHQGAAPSEVNNCSALRVAKNILWRDVKRLDAQTIRENVARGNKKKAVHAHHEEINQYYIERKKSLSPQSKIRNNSYT
jgi:hypothetical protein